MPWAESVRIETPEQIDFDLEVAGPGSRFVAQLIDWIIKWLVLLGIGLAALFAIVAMHGNGPEAWPIAMQNLVIAVTITFAFAFFFGYDIYYEGQCNGQTPGKSHAGIRVVRDTGGPIDAKAAAIRNVVGLADFLPGLYLLGGVTMLLNSRAQRLGDLAAGTIVIREPRESAPDEVEEWIKEWASDAFVFGAEHLDGCGPKDVHVIHSLFARLESLESRQQRQLTESLRDIFLKKTGYVHSQPLYGRKAVLSFMASLYRDLQARQRNA
jgi:uncharacterized RDD family membrane protein YckC